MKTVHFRCMLAGALAPIAGLLIATPAAADLILNFDNGRPDASTLPAYITFTGAAPGGFDATIAGTRTVLQEGVSYSLSTLAAGVDVTQYTSGRVFVSLGSPLSGFAKLLDPTGQIRNHLWPLGDRRSHRRRQSQLDRFLWHPPAAADEGRQSADDAHVELQRRGQHGRGLPDPRRPRELQYRYSCRHPRRPRRRRRERRHDQHAERTPGRGGSHHRAKHHEWRDDAVSKLRQLPELSPDGRTRLDADLGHDRGSERTILERRTVPEL